MTATRSVRTLFLLFGSLGVVFLIALTGCGTGGGGSSSTPDFLLSITGGNLSLNEGSNQTATISSVAWSGFTGSISVSFAGLPTGVTVSPASFTLNGTASQAVQISVSASAPLITGATISIQGTSGSLTHQATLSLTILGPAGFTLSSPSSISLLPGISQPLAVTVTGVNDYAGLVTLSITGLPSGVTVFPTSTVANPGNTVTFTLSASSTASGSTTATIAGTSGTLTGNAQTAVSVSTGPDYTLSSGIFTGLVVYAGSSSTFTVTAKAYNGFHAPVAVSLAGLPAGVTATPSNFSITPTSSGTTQQVTMDAALATPVPTTTNINVQGVSGSFVHQATFQMDVNAPLIGLSVQPSSLTIPAGSFAQVNLLVSGLYGNAVTGTVTETLSGLPTGVTATPPSATNPASGASQSFYLQAAASGAKSGAITFTANYGPYTATTKLPVTIGPAQSGTPVAARSRSTYIRTGSTTDFGALPAPTLTLYHSATGRFFSSDPYLGHLYVVDAATEKLTATINIPGAFGIDQAPDGSSIYVGTFAGDIYVVDPIEMVITKRYPASAISPYGFHANAVFAMASGKLLLMQYFVFPYLSWVDGNGPIALWNPADNSIVKFVTKLDGGPMPERLTCFDHFEHLILTASRTRAILTPTLTSEGSSQLCSLDPEAGTWNLSPTLYDAPTQDTNSVSEFASSPDGKTVVTYNETKVYVLDSTTLQIKNSFPAPVKRFNFVYPNMIIGPDNQTLYLNDPSVGTVLYAYSLTSGQLIGWAPQIEASSSYKWYEPSNPYMQAISSNGLIAGPLDNGIGLLDTQALNPPPIGTTFGFSALQVATGAPTGGTETAWIENQFPQASPAPLGSAYFGSVVATNVSSGGSGTIYADSPAGPPGPADVRITTTDGGWQLLPEAFSYGPWIMEAPTSYATAEGGGPAQIFGYGFGPVARISIANLQYLAPPNGLAVSVGAQSATLTGYAPAPYAKFYPVMQPFPTQGISYTVPPGVAGASSPIVVTSADGTNSGQNTVMQYLPATQRFAAPGSQLVDGVYDKLRDLYYFTDTNQIRVFSRTRAQWMNPIPIPVPAHPAGPQRLFGLAISADGSKLAVTDAGALAIYVLNPDSPSSVTTYPLAADLSNTPSGVAITNAGTVYFMTFDQLGDGQFNLYRLNTSGQPVYVTGQYRALQGDNANEYDLRMVMSADGSRVYFCNDGQFGYVDTATNTYQTPNSGPLNSFSGGFELALSPDQSRVAAGGLITDSNGNGVAMQSLGWNAGYDANYVYGAAFSSDGTVLFQPGVNSIDVFDGFAGDFLSRISLPFELSGNYRALVSDGSDNVLVAITGAAGDGIAIVDLSGVARPPVRPFLSYGPSSSNETALPAAASTRPSLTWKTGQRPFFVHYRQPPSRNVVRSPATTPVAPTSQ